MGKIVKDDLVNALAKRFDYQSARNVTGRLLKETGLTAQTDFSAADVKKIGAALSEHFSRVDNALAALSALGGGAAEKAAPAKKAPAKKAPAKAKAAPKAEEKAEEKAEDKPEEKAAEAKAEEKPAAKKPTRRTTRKKAPAKKAEA